MKGSLMSAIHHLRAADEYLQDFIRESMKRAGYNRGVQKFGDYSKRLNWILLDMKTYPHFNDEIREGLKQEMSSDAFAYVAIAEKCSLLSPQQRELMDEALDSILKGEKINIEFRPEQELA